ncbi:hypothetical protein DFJ73DRAFT_863901 [Zopfochytrium polystomum]|nr:hypothetical protein DFJ73DRAFT_863901 [Zopfochytrium polystomum]
MPSPPLLRLTSRWRTASRPTPSCSPPQTTSRPSSSPWQSCAHRPIRHPENGSPARSAPPSRTSPQKPMPPSAESSTRWSSRSSTIFSPSRTAASRTRPPSSTRCAPNSAPSLRTCPSLPIWRLCSTTLQSHLSLDQPISTVSWSLRPVMSLPMLCSPMSRRRLPRWVAKKKKSKSRRRLPPHPHQRPPRPLAPLRGLRQRPPRPPDRPHILLRRAHARPQSLRLQLQPEDPPHLLHRRPPSLHRRSRRSRPPLPWKPSLHALFHASNHLSRSPALPPNPSRWLRLVLPPCRLNLAPIRPPRHWENLSPRKSPPSTPQPKLPLLRMDL